MKYEFDIDKDKNVYLYNIESIIPKKKLNTLTADTLIYIDKNSYSNITDYGQ